MNRRQRYTFISALPDKYSTVQSSQQHKSENLWNPMANPCKASISTKAEDIFLQLSMKVMVFHYFSCYFVMPTSLSNGNRNMLIQTKYAKWIWPAFNKCAVPPVEWSAKLKTRSPAVARIADHTGYQWLSRSFKVNDFHSNLDRISHRFRDMTSFPLKNAHFSYPLSPFNPEVENVALALDRWNFACLSLWYRANFSCEKFSPST